MRTSEPVLSTFHPARAGRAFLSLCLLLLFICSASPAARADERPANIPSSLLVIAGQVYDRQGQPVEGASVKLCRVLDEEAIAQAESQKDGHYVMELIGPLPPSLRVCITRVHFRDASIVLGRENLTKLHSGRSAVIPDITLHRRLTPAFWIATGVFFFMIIGIATGVLHNTLAALLGITVIFAVSYLGSPLCKGLYIFDFKRALHFLDWNVIFLIMGMMIFIAVIERTGLFQWMAFTAYRLSRGRARLLLAILMVITGVASACLDNVTTMLLMTPITVRIALAMGINPLALLIPEVLVSNVVGISTIIGTPTNILIGSYAKISFNDFLVNLTPGVLLSLAGLILYCEVIYGGELKKASVISDRMLEKLEENAQITQPGNLRKAGWIGGIMLVLFAAGEHVHLGPAVTALMGSTVLLVWIKPDIDEMIEAVDWTTLVFFMALFIVVGAIQEVGLISCIAETLGNMVGTSLPLAMLAIIWIGGLLSTVIPNIPFTAAMLPVISYLTGTVPGAESKALYYCLSVGSAMGGNGSLIGASANMVTAGIAERAGYPITYMYFFKKGFPALLITILLATIWLLLRFPAH